MTDRNNRRELTAAERAAARRTFSKRGAVQPEIGPIAEPDLMPEQKQMRNLLAGFSCETQRPYQCTRAINLKFGAPMILTSLQTLLTPLDGRVNASPSLNISGKRKDISITPDEGNVRSFHARPAKATTPAKPIKPIHDYTLTMGPDSYLRLCAHWGYDPFAASKLRLDDVISAPKKPRETFGERWEVIKKEVTEAAAKRAIEDELKILLVKAPVSIAQQAHTLWDAYEGAKTTQASSSKYFHEEQQHILQALRFVIADDAELEKAAFNISKQCADILNSYGTKLNNLQGQDCVRSDDAEAVALSQESAKNILAFLGLFCAIDTQTGQASPLQPQTALSRLREDAQPHKDLKLHTYSPLCLLDMIIDGGFANHADFLGAMLNDTGVNWQQMVEDMTTMRDSAKTMRESCAPSQGLSTTR